MKAFICAALLAVVSGDQSHHQVVKHGNAPSASVASQPHAAPQSVHAYGYGHEKPVTAVHAPAAVPHHTPYHPAPYHPAPVAHTVVPVHHAPAPYHPAPVVHHAAPYHPAPVVHHAAPIVHHAPVVKVAPHHPAPYHPAPAAYKPS